MNDPPQNLLALDLSDEEILKILETAGLSGYRLEGAARWIRWAVGELVGMDERE